jgi:hypothetical protein
MSFWRGGAKKRRDANEPAILEALRAVGAECWQISGRSLPDLLVRYRGVYYAAEVKTLKGRLRETQGAFPVWRTVDDALRAIGAV